MNSRERVIAALEHEQPDRTPYCVDFTHKAHAAMARYLNDPEFDSKIGNDVVSLDTGLPGGWREISPNIWEDEFGVQWDQSVDKDIGVVCNQALTADTVDEFQWPDAHAPERWNALRHATAHRDGRFLVANLGFSLFERAWTLYGMENLLMDMMAAPDFVHRLLDAILEHNLARIEEACALEIDAMMFGDDWGSQQGLITGIDRWREFIGPRVRAMYQAVRARGKYVFIHSCGRVDSLFPDLIESGLHCFNPFQPEVMDPFEMKKRYGAQLSFFGGISIQRTLPYATPAQVREEVKRLLNEVGRDGGYIASPSHAIPGDARPENIAAMLEVMQYQ